MERLQRMSEWAGRACSLCAVHCVVTPLLVLALPAFAAAETLERGVLAGVSLLAAPVGLGSLRLHRRPGPLALLAIGLGAWWAALAWPFQGPLTWLAPAAGSVVVAVSLFWNARLVRAVHDGGGAACPAPGGAHTHRHPLPERP